MFRTPVIGCASGSNLEYHGNVFVAGLTAAGKTTHCYLLAGRFGLSYVCGSQIHLAINGLGPIQDRTFWVTERARELVTRSQFEQVDRELCHVERRICGAIFDSWIMPWRKSRNGLCIYLESTFESRVMKAAVSRREINYAVTAEYREDVRKKDLAAITLYHDMYDVDITRDLSCFDLILDISSFIDAPTFEASQASIMRTQKVLDAAVGYYFTGSCEYRRTLEEYRNSPHVRRNRLVE